jgi:hypothetical protein
LAVFRRVFIQLGERINQFVPLARRQQRERLETPVETAPATRDG